MTVQIKRLQLLATKEGKAAQCLAKIKCFNCGEKGYLARACPHSANTDKDDAEPPLAGMMLDACPMSTDGCIKNFYEVCIDYGNIGNTWLLTNLRTASHTYRSMNGAAETHKIGYLDGFFDCRACVTCPANIFSMTNIEDMYPIQGVSITVQMED